MGDFEALEQQLRESISGTDYNFTVNDYGKVVDPLDREIRALTQEGNVANQLGAIGEKLYGYDFPIGAAPYIEALNQLEEKGIINDWGPEYVDADLESLRSVFEQFFPPDYDRSVETTKNWEPDMEEQKMVVSKIEELNVRVARAKFMAENGLSPNKIGDILNYWEEEYEVDLKVGGTASGTKWNIDRLEEETDVFERLL